MKYLILTLLFISSLCIFTSCDCDEYEYTLVYEVYWNSNTVEHKTIKSNSPINCYSYKGTNTVYTREKGVIEDTTAPIREISYTKKKISR